MSKAMKEILAEKKLTTDPLAIGHELELSKLIPPDVCSYCQIFALHKSLWKKRNNLHVSLITDPNIKPSKQRFKPLLIFADAKISETHIKRKEKPEKKTLNMAIILEAFVRASVPPNHEFAIYILELPSDNKPISPAWLYATQSPKFGSLSGFGYSKVHNPIPNGVSPCLRIRVLRFEGTNPIFNWRNLQSKEESKDDIRADDIRKAIIEGYHFRAMLGVRGRQLETVVVVVVAKDDRRHQLLLGKSKMTRFLLETI